MGEGVIPGKCISPPHPAYHKIDFVVGEGGLEGGLPTAKSISAQTLVFFLFRAFVFFVWAKVDVRERNGFPPPPPPPPKIDFFWGGGGDFRGNFSPPPPPPPSAPSFILLGFFFFV